MVEVSNKQQTANGKHSTSKTAIANSNSSYQSKTLFSCFSFDLTKAVPKTSSWIKLPDKQLERPNQEEDWSNQR